jgi:hypothetical protein
MFTELLSKYKHKGNFTFKVNENLKEKCNAPTNKGGIYLIYKTSESTETLIYIGSSGQKVNGKLKVRKSGLGGMKDRLVNGYHPKFERIARRKTFPKQMIEEKISQIKVYWWVTYEENIFLDFPTDIETKLRDKYLEKNTTMPEWHK